MRTAVARGAALLLVGTALVSCDAAPKGAANRAESAASVSAANTTAGSARRGHALLTAFRDSLPAQSGNELRCTSCHLDNGVRPTALSWIGTAAGYPRYRSRRGSIETLEQRVNECITRSLAGKALPERGQEMRDIVAYIDSLGTTKRPAPPDSVKLAGVASRGERVYAGECARCHGVNGDGLVAPAVWGRDSYAVSAGMARQITLASFVKHNMPYDRAGSLTPQMLDNPSVTTESGGLTCTDARTAASARTSGAMFSRSSPCASSLS